MTFSSLGLAAPLLQALETLGYETPTPIQAQAIPAVLAIGGTWLATRDAIARGAWKEIADACKAAINRVAEIRGRATRKD